MPPRVPSYPCVVCSKTIRTNQQAFQCDSCDRWQHRTCNTSFTRQEYLDIVNGDFELPNWYCTTCSLQRQPPQLHRCPPLNITERNFRAVDVEEIVVKQRKVEQETTTSVQKRILRDDSLYSPDCAKSLLVSEKSNDSFVQRPSKTKKTEYVISASPTTESIRPHPTADVETGNHKNAEWSPIPSEACEHMPSASNSEACKHMPSAPISEACEQMPSIPNSEARKQMPSASNSEHHKHIIFIDISEEHEHMLSPAGPEASEQTLHTVRYNNHEHMPSKSSSREQKALLLTDTAEYCGQKLLTAMSKTIRLSEVSGNVNLRKPDLEPEKESENGENVSSSFSLQTHTSTVDLDMECQPKCVKSKFDMWKTDTSVEYHGVTSAASIDSNVDLEYMNLNPLPCIIEQVKSEREHSLFGSRCEEITIKNKVVYQYVDDQGPLQPLNHVTAKKVTTVLKSTSQCSGTSNTVGDTDKIVEAGSDTARAESLQISSNNNEIPSQSILSMSLRKKTSSQPELGKDSDVPNEQSPGLSKDSPAIVLHHQDYSGGSVGFRNSSLGTENAKTITYRVKNTYNTNHLMGMKCPQPISSSPLQGIDEAGTASPLNLVEADVTQSSDHNLPVISCVEARAFYLWSSSELYCIGDSAGQEPGLTSGYEGKMCTPYSNIRNPSVLPSICNSKQLFLCNSESHTNTIPSSSDMHYSDSQISSSSINQTDIHTSTSPATLHENKEKSNSQKSKSSQKASAFTGKSKSLVAEKTSTVKSTQISIPKIAGCIATWKKVFPWVLFEETSRIFTCSLCHKWDCEIEGSGYLLMLREPKDVFSVAAYLRKHQETSNHGALTEKYSFIKFLVQSFREFMMENIEFNDIGHIANHIHEQYSECFPDSLCMFDGEIFSCLIRAVAMSIEDKLLSSLSESPVFSIISSVDMQIAIVRWVNQNMEPEEHLICTQVSSPDVRMTITSYLARRKIDMARLEVHSITTFSALVNSNISHRIPPLGECVRHLQYLPVIRQIYYCFDLLIKICLAFPDRFSWYVKIKEVLQTTILFKAQYVIHEDIIDFYFNHTQLLKDTCRQIYTETKYMNAYKFCLIDIGKYWVKYVKDIMLLLYVINDEVAKVDIALSHPISITKRIQGLLHTMSRKLKLLSSKDSEEYKAIFIVSTYLSHIVLSLSSVDVKYWRITTLEFCKLAPEHLEILFPKVSQDLAGGSKECLQLLTQLHSSLSKDSSCTILEVFQDLARDPPLQKEFPYLVLLYQKLLVLPYFPCSDELHIFTLAAYKIRFSSILDKMLDLHMVVLQEKSQWNEMQTDNVLSFWHKSFALQKNLNIENVS